MFTVQYLISELYQQILPTAQRLLDDLLSGAQTLDINAEPGAPDPTAGGSVGELSAWCLDSKNLRDNIKKILIKVNSRLQWPNLKNLSGGLNLSRGLNMVGST